MTLPVETAEELDLRSHLARGRGRASVERALSGQGVKEIYEWVCLRGSTAPRALTAAQIVSQALDHSDPQCRAAVETLVRLLARVAGDLFLAFLPLGGMYLSGGVTRACAPLIAGPQFWEEFTRKGRQTSLMRSVPIHIIEDDNAALAGCLSAMRTRPARASCA